MLASEMLASVNSFYVLLSRRDATEKMLEEHFPDCQIIPFDDFPYSRIAEPGRAISDDLLEVFRLRGCECLSYGNAAKAGTGEGVSSVVIRF